MYLKIIYIIIYMSIKWLKNILGKFYKIKMSRFKWCVLSLSICPQFISVHFFYSFFITFYWTRFHFIVIFNILALSFSRYFEFSDENAHFDTLSKRVRRSMCVYVCVIFIYSSVFDYVFIWLRCERSIYRFLLCVYLCLYFTYT